MLVTFEREAILPAMAAALAGQTRRLDSLTIVDNSAEPCNVSTLRAAAPIVETVHPGDNLGPAGGIGVGMRLALQRARDDDWIVVLDDDDPPVDEDDFARLADFADTCVGADPETSCVGRVGARIDPRTGMLLRPADREFQKGAPVEVDYVGGGQLPFYRVSAVRAIGVPRPELFFGFDDLEYGLRLRRAGFRLYADAALWWRGRTVTGRTGLASSLKSTTLDRVGWRTYYSRRNLIVILRQAGYTRAAIRTSFVALAKPVVNLPRTPRLAAQAMVLEVRAVFDGWTGRLGRRVQPTP